MPAATASFCGTVVKLTQRGCVGVKSSMVDQPTYEVSSATPKPIVGMLIPIIIVPTALGFKHARYLRQVEHDERMKAMELGQTLPGDQSWTPASIAMTIGAGGLPVPPARATISVCLTRPIGPRTAFGRLAQLVRAQPSHG